jgi:hypothetical protein
MVSLPRDLVMDYVERMLVGPADGVDEEVAGLPTKRYLMGLLFPQSASADFGLGEEQPDIAGASEGDLIADDPVALSGQWLPSSMGLSMFVEGGLGGVTCHVWGAAYDRIDDRPRRYQRRSLATSDQPAQCPLIAGQDTYPVLDGRAELRLRARSIEHGTLLTVSILNTRTADEDEEPEPEDCLYQVGLRVETNGARILEYPSFELLSRDLEEQELRLMHRNFRTFAVGHGCAVSWEGTAPERKDMVSTVLIPRFEVRGVTQTAPDGLDQDVLSVSRLGDPDVPWTDLRGELAAFVEAYATWGASERARSDIPATLEGARTRIADRIDLAAARMRAGVKALDNPDVLRAFRLANAAMALQRLRQEPMRGGTRRRRDQITDLSDDLAESTFRWYPFQLAFQLLVLPSMVDPDDDHRSDVDLIWFPTGGGKTEAYLAVAATEIFLRRLRDGDRGGGTTVLTRYTLRLLTAQQFQRAAATVCACEVLRRRDATALGMEPITIGLWVGDEAVPNKCAKAVERFGEVRQDEKPVNPFQLELCPWCGTEIMPERLDEDDAAYGIRASLDDFALFCPSRECVFHAELPVQVIDEVLYTRPPTILLGTVDKFAQLAWNAAGLSFFGSEVAAPPSLIIQDELHLLSGPLGTTVGVYEAAIEALCTRHGLAPKMVASTATIRRSDKQVKGLFGGRGVRLFPPAGVDATNSFFARQDTERPGRLYVGVMAQSHTLSTAMVHLSAALLQGVAETELPLAERDAYWTLVAYHNSLRELGRTVTLARDDVPARLKGIAEGSSSPRELGDDDVVELTSNVGGTNLTGILERMKRTVDSPDVISVLACTNMLSVGVDVGRLGLMVVNGQPKTTSEYIQATSRVGRGGVPGLVVSLYTATKPRDRSHYEAFLPYHAAVYRYVEPTSVTPWSSASRDRALHAAFVILVRAYAGLVSNSDAHRFEATATEVARARDLLVAVIGQADPEEADQAALFLARRIEEWSMLIEKAEELDKKLHFRPGGKGVRSLLRNFGEKGDGWETLQSMRNVDRECLVAVQGEK